MIDLGLRDSRPWGGRKRLHFSYIDDTVVIIIGKRSEVEALMAECDRMMATALAAYRKAGIPVKDEKVEAAALVDVEVTDTRASPSWSRATQSWQRSWCG